MEKEKSCSNCKYDHMGFSDEPCVYCRNAFQPYTETWENATLLWQPMDAPEAVDHPAHYNQGKYECIDVMVETFGKYVTQNFCLLNAFKYVWRTGEKNGAEDVKKARWYLDKYLELEGESNE